MESRKVDRTGLLSWRSNKYSAPMVYQGCRVGVRSEAGMLILSDLENGDEIARHRISHDKGIIIRINDHYRDKKARIADLEADIRGHVGDSPGKRLCAVLKATSPRIYKDQLVALKRLLGRYPNLPQKIFLRLIDRDRLTASQCKIFFEAYTADPARFLDSSAPPPAASSGALEPYAAVVSRQKKEVSLVLH